MKQLSINAGIVRCHDYQRAPSNQKPGSLAFPWVLLSSSSHPEMFILNLRIAIGSWAPHLFHLSDPPFTTRSYVHLATQAN